jgi:hypothetical protein
VLGRFKDSLNFYQGRLIQTTSGALQVQLVKTAAGANTALSAPVQVASSAAAGSAWKVRLHIQGSALSIRAWADGTSEPSTWTSTATDAAPFGSGSVGIMTQAYGGSTATPSLSFDDFAVTTA